MHALWFLFCGLSVKNFESFTKPTTADVGSFLRTSYQAKGVLGVLRHKNGVYSKSQLVRSYYTYLTLKINGYPANLGN